MSAVLLTGAAGFLGRHLTRALKARGHLVLGADLRQSPDCDESLIIDGEATLAAAVRSRRPALVVHAAFLNRRPEGCTEAAYLEQMTSANLELLEAAVACGARLLLVSSSAVYGKGGGRELIDEDCPRQPVTLYGVAKASQEMLAEYQAAARDLPQSIVRLFNLCGPGQALGMLIPDWVSRAVKIASGGEPVLLVPTMATSRDFVDVRDAARAIALLVDKFHPGTVWNVASGQATSLREVGEELRRICPVPFEVVETSPAPDGSNVLAQRGSFAAIRAACGWQPEIDWRHSLRDVWEEWLARAA